MHSSTPSSLDEEPLANLVLLVDRDVEVHKAIGSWLHAFDDVLLDCVTNNDEALTLWREKRHRVVIYGNREESSEGLGLLATIVKSDSDAQVILISDADDPQEVVSALRLGAADFIKKPLDSTVLVHAVFRGLAEYRLKHENRKIARQLEQKNRELNESLRLLQEDQEAGRAVQARLLPPREAEFNGVSLEYILSPSLYLSGDFVDYFRISKTRFGFYLADVSGHGAASAFVTILLKNIALTIGTQYRKPGMPSLNTSKILELANQELIPLQLGKHLAVFCAIIDTEKNTLQYSSASHFPPPLLFVEGEEQFLRGKGLPVGLFNDASYDRTEVPLGENYRFVAFSDGVLEFINLPSMADKERFLMEMVKKGNHNVSSMLNYLDIDINEPAPDDLAILMCTKGNG